jgi:hypothetical protein
MTIIELEISLVRKALRLHNAKISESTPLRNLSEQMENHFETLLGYILRCSVMVVCFDILKLKMF